MNELAYLSAALIFYGAWSIDFAWRAREMGGYVGLPYWPGKHIWVRPDIWFYHAFIGMMLGGGFAAYIYLLSPVAGAVSFFVGFGIGLSLYFIWWPWYKNHEHHAFIWNVAFFFGLVPVTFIAILV